MQLYPNGLRKAPIRSSLLSGLTAAVTQAHIDFLDCADIESTLVMS